SEEHTSELQSRRELVCRLLLEKKNGQQFRLRSDCEKNLPNHSRRICSRRRSPPGSRHRSSDDPIFHSRNHGTPAMPESKPIQSNFRRLNEKEISSSCRARQALVWRRSCQEKTSPKGACAMAAASWSFRRSCRRAFCT